MKRISLIILSVLILASCGNDEKKAKELLGKAQTSYEQGKLNQAKLQIDSIRVDYKGEVETIKEGVQLMRKINIQENKRTLAYADSLLVIKRAEVDSLLQYFSFNKEEGIEDMGHYLHKRLTIERNIERCYIRPQVNEYGDLSLASVYYGPREIKHTGLKMAIGDGSTAETMVVPFDGGRNYRFNENGNFSEIVTYNQEALNNIADFVLQYKDQRIKVYYTGGSSYIIYLDDVTKNAIADSYALAIALSDVTRLQQEAKIAGEKINFLERKVAEQGV